MVPATLIGRLAVSTSFRGQRHGETLLMDALHRILQHSREVASACAIVDAIDDAAILFIENMGFSAPSYFQALLPSHRHHQSAFRLVRHFPQYLGGHGELYAKFDCHENLSLRMKNKRILVKSSAGEYTIVCGEGILRDASSEVRKLGRFSRVHVVSSSKVWRAVGKSVQRGLGAKNIHATHLMDDAESAKNLFTLEKLERSLVRGGIDRHSLIIAVGGGVVGDVAGFAASTIQRGVSLVQIPTTLIAQVDSAVGGKTGVNLPEGKNLVGTFYPARLVLVDSAMLRHSRNANTAAASPKSSNTASSPTPNFSPIPRKIATPSSAAIPPRSPTSFLARSKSKPKSSATTSANRSPRNTQLRPPSPRPRNPHQLSRLPARRGRRLGHDGRRPPRPRTPSHFRQRTLPHRLASPPPRPAPSVAQRPPGKNHRRHALRQKSPRRQIALRSGPQNRPCRIPRRRPPRVRARPPVRASFPYAILKQRGNRPRA